MGDRISIQFINGKEKSVVLFSHWQGKGLLQMTKTYLSGLKADMKATGHDNPTLPLTRYEPNTVMLDFIVWLGAKYKKTDKTRLKLYRAKGKEGEWAINGCIFGSKHIDSDLYLGATEEDGDNSDNGHFLIPVPPQYTKELVTS